MGLSQHQTQKLLDGGFTPAAILAAVEPIMRAECAKGSAPPGSFAAYKRSLPTALSFDKVGGKVASGSQKAAPAVPGYWSMRTASEDHRHHEAGSLDHLWRVKALIHNEVKARLGIETKGDTWHPSEALGQEFVRYMVAHGFKL